MLHTVNVILKLKISRKVPVNGHITFEELINFDNIDKVIPKTSEIYMSIIVNRNIVYLDSNQFYKGKLDNHASNLEDKDFKYLLSEFSIDKLELLKGKDAYPYKWVDFYEKFNYQELPPKECFYFFGKRDNNNGYISDEKYSHLQNIWNTFNFNTFRDFHNHYLKKMYYY